MFKIGDKVRFAACPYDEQIADEVIKFISLQDKEQVVVEVKDVTHLKGTTGQWIRTDLEPNWTDKFWYVAI